MQNIALTNPAAEREALRVNQIDFTHPWQWLIKGRADIKAAPGYSLTYGAGIVLIGAVMTLLMALGHLTFLVPFLMAGFFLLAPLLAIGLYQMSDNLERGESLKTCQALDAFKRNQSQLGITTGVLIMLMQAWILASVFLFIMLFTDPFPSLDNFVQVVFLSGQYNLILLAFIVVGAGFAVCAFCISAITVPMLIDRPVDAFTAMRTSVRAVTVNWGPMLLWAALIVCIVGVGLLTFYIGLFIAVPLVGHATWHAYRDLVPGD